jgi:hypothetical protein
MRGTRTIASPELKSRKNQYDVLLAFEERLDSLSGA